MDSQFGRYSLRRRLHPQLNAFFVLLVIITTLATFSTTSPLPNTTNTTNTSTTNTTNTTTATSPLLQRDTSQPGVYICALELFQPPCQHLPLTLGPDLPCLPLPYASASILSFGPDHDVTCILFHDDNCDRSKGGTATYNWPGTDFLMGPGYVDLQTGRSGGGYRAYGCRGGVDLEWKGEEGRGGGEVGE